MLFYLVLCCFCFVLFLLLFVLFFCFEKNCFVLVFILICFVFVFTYTEYVLFVLMTAFLQHDNPHMRTCFRRMPMSLSACARSMFEWHNDTLNIHSHLSAAIVYAVYGVWLWQRFAPLRANNLVMATHLPLVVGIFVCAWLCSALYHTFRAHSLKTFNW